jgi:hypothetical protein
MINHEIDIYHISPIDYATSKVSIKITNKIRIAAFK